MSKFRWLVVLLLGLLAVLLVLSQKSRAVPTPAELFGRSDEWFKKGKHFQDRRNYRAALQAFDQAIKIDPSNMGAWSEKAISLSNLGRRHEALQCFDKVLKEEPDSISTLYIKAYTLIDLGEFSQAIDCYDQIIRLQPDSVNAWYEEASVLVLQQKYSQALATFNLALMLNPENPEIWMDKGLLLEELGQKNQALQCYEKMLAYKKDTNREKVGESPRFVSRFGRCSKPSSNPSEKRQKITSLDPKAVKAYQKALKSNPADLNLLLDYGKLLIDLERPQEAFKCFQKAIALKPGYTAAWYEIGYLLEHNLGEYQKALEYYQKLVEIKRKEWGACRT